MTRMLHDLFVGRKVRPFGVSNVWSEGVVAAVVPAQNGELVVYVLTDRSTPRYGQIVKTTLDNVTFPDKVELNDALRASVEFWQPPTETTKE